MVLWILLLLVFLLPLTVTYIERHLIFFLLIMGVIAIISSGHYSTSLLYEALISPIPISLVVVVTGSLLYFLHQPMHAMLNRLQQILPFRFYIFLLISCLGLMSSLITAIISSFLLIQIVKHLGLDRQSSIRFAVFACYAIGLGAVLTPIGEPVSTITTMKLQASFFYLFSILGPYVVPGILFLGGLAALFVHPATASSTHTIDGQENLFKVIAKGIHVYFFVVALTFLGAALAPNLSPLLLRVDLRVLYWLNSVSAILDNATLASAEMSPMLDSSTVTVILLALLISGGMLIQGNIPNIIAAHTLNITSREWARVAIPLGFIVMLIYYIILFYNHIM